MSETPAPGVAANESVAPRYRTEPEPVLAHRPPRRVSPSGILNPPGRWRSLLTFTLILLLLLGSAFITAFLVYQQSAAQRVRDQMQDILRQADGDLPEGYRKIIPILRRHADLLGREETGERMARYIIYLALFHGDTGALEHAAEARSLAETRSRRKGQYYKTIFEIARLLVDRRHTLAQLEAEKALIHHPRSDLLLYELALARAGLGSWEAAHSSLEMALILKERSQLPLLVELAQLERRRGQLDQAARIVDEVLRRSPKHPVARLEQQLCLALAEKPFGIPPLPPTDGATGLPEPIAYRHHLLLALAALKRGDFVAARASCGDIPEAYPEAAWCKSRVFLRAPGEPAEFVALVPRLQQAPFPDLACTMMDFYLMTHRPLAARAQLEECLGESKTGPPSSRRIHLAILEEDVTTLSQACPEAASPDTLWICIDGAVRLRRWDLLERLERHALLPQADRVLLRRLIFTDAFGLVTTTEPPSDCTPRGQFLRTRWSRRALRAGAVERALGFQERTVTACPYSVHHRLTHLELLVTAGLHAEALKLADSMEDLAHAPSLFRLGSLVLQLERPQTALYWANILMRQFPDDYRGYLLSAIVERNNNRWRQFQENIETAQKLSLHAPVLREHRATWEAYQGRYTEAEAILKQHPQLDPDDAELWSTLAQMIQREQPLQAARWYQTAVAAWLERKSPAAASRVLVAYAQGLDPLTERNELKRVVGSLKALPELHPEAHAYLSRHIQGIDRHDPEVIRHMEDAVRLAPCNAEYRLRLGTLLADVDRVRAEEQFQKILTLRPTPLTEQAKERLQKLQRETPPPQATP